MEGLTKNLICSFVLSFSLLTKSAALDTIAANEAIRDGGDTIVSAGEMFELGFFSPGKSTNRYLGIWYKKIATGTVVWVANRDTSITTTSGLFQVTSHGDLQVRLSGGTTTTMVWSSNSSVTSLDPVAQLMDTGNLVVWGVNKSSSSSDRNLIWQSFDYPGDTMLPGMKFGKDLVTGIHRNLTSWKSPDDPSTGAYVAWVDTNGYPQIFHRKGPVLLSRNGPWNGLGFRSFPYFDNPNPNYSLEFVVHQKEIWFRYQLISSVFMKILLNWDGKTMHMNWIDRIQDWVIYRTSAVHSCGRYGLCGPYGSCSLKGDPPCSCMEGFEQRIPEAWKAEDWSSGCQRKKNLDCGNGDGFRKFPGMKFPDTRRSWYSNTMSLVECETACKRNCSCTAYANLDIRNGGSGCLLWFDELMDVIEGDKDEDIYIRMAASELDEGNGVIKTGPDRKKTVLIVCLSAVSTGLFLSVVMHGCRNKKKRPHVKGGRGNLAHLLGKDYTRVLKEHVDELTFFSRHRIAEATNNFSIKNKIGEGGFGPVYKGVLRDGQEIAVKRLSETSQQGVDEFKNEIVCNAKLQHRNLVKLLGYCIHGDEMILIYEYMANKSLDSVLFGSSTLALSIITVSLYLSLYVEFLAKSSTTLVNFWQMKPEVRCLIGPGATASSMG